MSPLVLLLVSLVLAAAVPATAAPARKVLVLGVDGLDPKLLRAYMDRGILPHIERLVQRGDFTSLQTSMPPLSPVAWSTFITGMDPGGHGIFDFIHRDPATMLPDRAESVVQPGSSISLGGCRALPVGGGGPQNLRQGRAFWQILEEHGVGSVVLRMPANFPPVDSGGKSLSGMGTPDILGTPGTFSFYTDRHVSNANDIRGGKVYPVQPSAGRVDAKLRGPWNPFLEGSDECKKQLEVGFSVHLDPERPAAKFEVQDEEFVLQQGEWSDWVRVDFKALPLFASVSAIGRFYLKQVRPQFELYVTPLQIDPQHPGAMQISTPKNWSHELCEELGYFYTKELPEDTKALSGGFLSAREFWQQTQFVYDELRRAFDYAIGSFEEGLLFFYFSSVDQNSHMLWNYTDRAHPGFREDELLAGGIEQLYRSIDEVVGRALDTLPEDATIVLMSDHGFAPFYWQVQLNSWLVEKGYATLRDPAHREAKWFGDVDWSRTRAYAVGLNGLYVNLRGRERTGIVEPGAEHGRLLRQIERDLLEMIDPRNGQHPVSLVVDPRRDFHGPLVESGPDLVVGYSWGYRTSWKSPLGEFPRETFTDNTEAWSGDHSMDYRLVPGVLIANRPITLDAPALHDLTVAILDEYGVPKAKGMIGNDCLGDR